MSETSGDDADELLSSSEWRALARVWSRAIAWDAADVEGAVLYVLSELSRVLEAAQGFATIGLQLKADPGDPLLGWRPGPTLQCRYTAEQARLVDEFERSRAYLHDPFLRRLAEGCGVKRVVIQSEVLDHLAETAPAGKLLREIGGGDRVVAGSPIAADLDVLLGFNRSAGSPPFGESERAVLLEALEGLDDLCRRFALSHGLVAASRPLTPREREVAFHLLSGESEKEIAARLGIAWSSLHRHVVTLFRKFGVGSRAQFMSLWLSRGRS